MTLDNSTPSDPLLDIDNIPKEELASFIKQNYPDLWLDLAWGKVNSWRDSQKIQQKLLGDTPDYNRQLFTLDPAANKMVNFAFKKYWEDGLLYKSSYLINWSVGLQTALSDVSGEIEYQKRIDPFVSFEYQFKRLEIKSKNLQAKFTNLIDNFLKKPDLWLRLKLSTVRPETKFTDLAVAMHPDKFVDYINLEIFENQKINFDQKLAQEFLEKIFLEEIELFYHIPALDTFEVKLVFSEKVDSNFGTGIVKITPGHDLFDYQLYKELVENDKLPANAIQTCIDRSGKLKKEFCHEFTGLTVEQGRLAVIKKLAETGFIPVKKEFKNFKSQILKHISTNLQNQSFNVKNFSYEEGQKKLQEILGEEGQKLEIDWNYEHNVSICERTKTVIEPLISEEFFLSYKTKVNSTNKNLQEYGLEGIQEIEFFSSDYKQRATNFVENINDWCISRNLIWGHKIPVWYNLDLNPEKKFYNFKQFTSNQKIQKTDKNGNLVSFFVQDCFWVDSEKPQKSGNWVQEEKILDTWFNSCLWPLSTLNYLEYLEQKEQIVVIGGGDSFDSYQEYFENLKTRKPKIDEKKETSWKENLKINLEKENFSVYLAKMPSKENAKYEEWKIWFEKILEFLSPKLLQNLSLVGHSLGGIFLIKYLSENNLSVKNLYLVSAPFSKCGDFVLNTDLSNLEKNCQNINFYHSKDDEVVDYSEFDFYKKSFRVAKFFEFEDCGHFLQTSFPELEKEISKPKIDIEINYAKVKDFQEIHKILSQSWLIYLPNSKINLTKEKINFFLENENSSEYIKKIIENDQNQNKFILKAEFEGQILGFLIYKKITNHKIEIEELNVLTEFQSKQVGRKLLLKLLENYPNIQKISLLVVKYNQKAENFYKRIGFRKGEFCLDKAIDFNGEAVEIPQFYMNLEKDDITLAKNYLQSKIKIKTDFERFYPTNEMITAKEIFYVWIVRMIILAKYFTKNIPFKKVIITPTILDEKGFKMSKSLGNGLDPATAINEFSSDSLRVSMLSTMIPNRNVKMGGKIAQEQMLKYRNFGNKLWNIARFFENQESQNEKES
jgi:valyl-tRNA synthetase/predicted alpha/beta hydrolase family esterase/ribosomal protein S18 acetylase RimI-like enzyme